PLVQIYHHAVAVQSAKQALKRLRHADSRELVLVDGTGKQPPNATDGNGHDQVNWQMLARSTVKYTLDVQSKHPCWVYINVANYPGWRATIDGSPARVWTAQVLGKAVYVPAGHHKLVVWFESDAFRIGCVISVVTLLIILILLAGA